MNPHSIKYGDFRKLRIDHIEPYLDEFPPVPLGIPTEKKNVVAHPCLDRDALEAARDLIRSLNPKDTNPYVLAGWGSGFGKKMGKDIPLTLTINLDNSATIRRKPT